MDFLVGYGEKVITPPLGLDLTGYGYYPDRKGESILDDLKVRALSVNSGENKVILISADLIGLTVEFSNTIRKKIASEQGLPPQNILLACIHTHTGPAVQPLRGCGNVAPDYLAKVGDAIRETANWAVSNQKESTISYRIETIEPIGFNRRKGNFEPIDPNLKIVFFDQGKEKVYLLSYACHPVTLCGGKAISADWPGAVVQEIEKTGNHGIFFQGFCGDIDPVMIRNRWGKGMERLGPGTKEDLIFYGNLLSQKAFRAERYADSVKDITIKAVERRIKLPLKVLKGKEEIEQEAKYWVEKYYKDSLSGKRFFEEWKTEARERYKEFNEKPYLDDVPIQGISLGEIKILGLPGEVFCEIGLPFQQEGSSLFTFGYANGNIGYIPTKSAYAVTDDYACYLAPKMYDLFSFTPDMECILKEEIKKVLEGINMFQS